MLRTVSTWVVLTGVLTGCSPTPPPVTPSEAEVPAATAEPATKPAAEPAQASNTTEPEPEKPEFVTASQLRERLGVGESAHFERVGRGFVAAYLANTGVKDLTPLKGQSLQLLAIAQNPVSSLAGVEGMPLTVIDLSQTKITSLAPLQNCSTLTQVFFESTSIDNLEPLKGKRLSHLYATDCPISDLSPLAGMQFQELNLCGTRLTNLDGLKDVQTGILWLRDTDVSDVSPLSEMSITSLDLQGTKVADLSPLKSISSLQRLNIARTPVTDVSPLAALPLSRLIFSPDKIETGLDLIRTMPTLKEIDTQFDGEQPQAMPASEFWERYDAGEFKSESAKSR